jgi:hypothetical protein
MNTAACTWSRTFGVDTLCFNYRWPYSNVFRACCNACTRLQHDTSGANQLLCCAAHSLTSLQLHHTRPYAPTWCLACASTSYTAAAPHPSAVLQPPVLLGHILHGVDVDSGASLLLRRLVPPLSAVLATRCMHCCLCATCLQCWPPYVCIVASVRLVCSAGHRMHASLPLCDLSAVLQRCDARRRFRGACWRQPCSRCKTATMKQRMSRHGATRTACSTLQKSRSVHARQRELQRQASKQLASTCMETTCVHCNAN